MKVRWGHKRPRPGDGGGRSSVPSSNHSVTSAASQASSSSATSASSATRNKKSDCDRNNKSAGVPIGESELSALCERLIESDPALTKLCLFDRNVGDAGLARIADAMHSNSALRWLDLQRNGITGLGAACLAGVLVEKEQHGDGDGGDNRSDDLGESSGRSRTLPLHTLRLWDNAVGDGGCASLGASLRLNSTLLELDLCKNSIGPRGAVWLAGALRRRGREGDSRCRLRKLWLWHNSIGDSGVTVLSEALAANDTLRELYLGFNDISARGVKATALALATNGTLQTLWLGGNSVSDGGAAHLAGALRSNVSLRELYLGMNAVGDVGAMALGLSLGTTNRTLTKLELYGNEIGDDGAVALGRAVSMNGTLQDLNLCSNRVGDRGAEALCVGLCDGRTPSPLLDLDIRDNHITKDAVTKKIERRIRDNRRRHQRQSHQLIDASSVGSEAGSARSAPTQIGRRGALPPPQAAAAAGGPHLPKAAHRGENGGGRRSSAPHKTSSALGGGNNPPSSVGDHRRTTGGPQPRASGPPNRRRRTSDPSAEYAANQHRRTVEGALPKGLVPPIMRRATSADGDGGRHAAAIAAGETKRNHRGPLAQPATGVPTGRRRNASQQQQQQQQQQQRGGQKVSAVPPGSPVGRRLRQAQHLPPPQSPTQQQQQQPQRGEPPRQAQHLPPPPQSPQQQQQPQRGEPRHRRSRSADEAAARAKRAEVIAKAKFYTQPPSLQARNTRSDILPQRVPPMAGKRTEGVVGEIDQYQIGGGSKGGGVKYEGGESDVGQKLSTGAFERAMSRGNDDDDADCDFSAGDDDNADLEGFHAREAGRFHGGNESLPAGDRNGNTEGWLGHAEDGFVEGRGMDVGEIMGGSGTPHRKDGVSAGRRPSSSQDALEHYDDVDDPSNMPSTAASSAVPSSSAFADDSATTDPVENGTVSADMPGIVEVTAASAADGRVKNAIQLECALDESFRKIDLAEAAAEAAAEEAEAAAALGRGRGRGNRRGSAVSMTSALAGALGRGMGKG